MYFPPLSKCVSSNKLSCGLKPLIEFVAEHTFGQRRGKYIMCTKWSIHCRNVYFPPLSKCMSSNKLLYELKPLIEFVAGHTFGQRREIHIRTTYMKKNIEKSTYC